jgi:hypothetical protein
MLVKLSKFFYSKSVFENQYQLLISNLNPFFYFILAKTQKEIKNNFLNFVDVKPTAGYSNANALSAAPTTCRDGWHAPRFKLCKPYNQARYQPWR